MRSFGKGLHIAVGALLVASTVFCSEGAAEEIDFNGAWVIVHIASFSGQGLIGSRDAEDRKVVSINHDLGSGETIMRQPQLTREMHALGYKPFNLGFEGKLEGNVAVGTAAGPRLGFWSANAKCPNPAGLQFSNKRRLELISAVPAREECKFSFSSFNDVRSLRTPDGFEVMRYVWTLNPLFVVRTVRFINLGAGGAATGAAITSAASGQNIGVEVEFDVSPPAPVYVTLRGTGGERQVSVYPTERGDVFRSNVIDVDSL